MNHPNPPGVPHLRRFDGPAAGNIQEQSALARPARPQDSEPPRPASGRGLQFLTSPWLWGGLLTVGFYALIPHFPIWRAEAERYFCAHWVEYAEVAFFFVGMTIVFKKALRQSREQAAYNCIPGLTGAESQPSTGAESTLSRLVERLDQATTSERQTYWCRRLDQLRAFFRNRRTDGLDDHLSFLSATADNELQESHAVLNLIIWAIPILGFLGTVLGITLAIANITPEQLDTSLTTVTAGLAVAFDTTALGLVQSLILGFASLFVRRSEERLLSLIDQRVRSEVHQVLPAEIQASPWVEAEAQAARELMERTGLLIESQTELWNSSVERFRDRWAETLDQQRAELAVTLAAGADLTLTDHARQLEQFRTEFVNAYQQVSSHLQAELSRWETGASDREQQFQAALQRFSSDFHLRLEAIWASREREEAWRAAATQSRLEAWQQEMARLHDSSRDLLTLLTSQSETLLNIYGKHENLAHLQQRLNENLEALRATEAFETAVHQLTGAVHLLTARARREAA